MAEDSGSQTPVTSFRVVVNHEEQYSIWPADREVPPGWRDVGKTGAEQECLDYIEEVWTDMRPASLRRVLDADATDNRRDSGTADRKGTRG